MWTWLARTRTIPCSRREEAKGIRRASLSSKLAGYAYGGPPRPAGSNLDCLQILKAKRGGGCRVSFLGAKRAQGADGNLR